MKPPFPALPLQGHRCAICRRERRRKERFRWRSHPVIPRHLNLICFRCEVLIKRWLIQRNWPIPNRWQKFETEWLEQVHRWLADPPPSSPG